MSSQTEDSTKKSLGTEQKQVSINYVNYYEILNLPEAKKIAVREKKIEDFERKNAQAGLSGVVFRWRGAIALAAILTIGVLHFAFQISFQNRISENIPAAEKPLAVSPIEAVPKLETAETIKPVEIDAKKRDRVSTRKIESVNKTRRIETAPVKPQIKRKAPVETTAERLRRAERILTGV